MNRTVTKLADGRELIYFDRSDGVRRDEPDRRDLERPESTSRVRYDPLSGEWVIIASHRQGRTHRPARDDCPLCPTRDGNQTEIPDSDYEVVVFENRFPALTGIPPAGSAPAVPTPYALLRSGPGAGRCEVICFSSDHDSSFVDLSERQVGTVLAAWIDRTRELAGRAGVEQVYCFENRGEEIGVTQTHPHGQIYGYPFATPRTARMIDMTTRYRRRHARNLFDDLLDQERADGARIVSSNDEWTAFVPFAARWPYEVHLYPHRRRADLTGLDEAQRESFAPIYLDLLRRFDRLFDAPAPYISGWHQAPVHEASRDFAAHLELFTNRRTSGKLKYLAGSESGMDVFANDISPEQAAERLRSLG